ncbi:MAG TPA: hypothetical protein VJ836_00250 [Candidatus Saccharimonadales bacterium]|nr:hypothetical protein [Candidatus Saccharimonadales bacterium]
MDQKQAIADRLKEANNILVTVSKNPSVDQLASCIGLTLALNKMDKHATAVFSGAVPNVIEFLQPEKTIEKNTDSLRDFIIALDKSKADKLRYKVEDKVVKIFITPYRTSISEKDLDFSQGDFNVDVVLALGVHNQADLDEAITSHGRILHDATVATLNVQPGGDLGSMNWLNTSASSLAELAVELLNAVDKDLLDGQMATAFLTGIVAETHRFSNDKTLPATMSISAELMAAGANQQLIATKLEEPPAPPPPPEHKPQEDREAEKQEQAAPPKPDDGTLEIAHDGRERTEQPKPTEESAPEPEQGERDEEAEAEERMPQIRIDEQGSLRNIDEEKEPSFTPEMPRGSTDPTGHMGSTRMILEPPRMGGELTANTVPEDMRDANPLGMPPPPVDPFMPNGGGSAFPSPPPASATIATPVGPPPSAFTPTSPPVTSPPASTPPVAPASSPLPVSQPAPPPPGQTLTEIEANVRSPHLQQAAVSPTSPPVASSSPVTSDNISGNASGPQPADSDLASARDAVLQALAAQPSQPEPIQALNAQPLGSPLHDNALQVGIPPQPSSDQGIPGGAQPLVVQPSFTQPQPAPPPPPVPPPMMPPSKG